MTHRPQVRQTRIGIAVEKSKALCAATTRAAIAAALVLSGVVSTARADDADFAKSKKCMNCHALDEKRVGPAYRAVAARYAADAGAEERLAKKIRLGGAGAWGVVPMPSNDEVSPVEAQRLARWVLMQK